jgi:hypothetical protein
MLRSAFQGFDQDAGDSTLGKSRLDAGTLPNVHRTALGRWDKLPPNPGLSSDGPAHDTGLGHKTQPSTATDGWSTLYKR